MLILFTDVDHRACKIWDGSNCIPYSAGVWFTHTTAPVNSIQTLSETLTLLQGCPQALVVRGTVRENSPDRIKRRYKPSADYAPHIDPSPQPWICLDFDQTTIPFNSENPAQSVAQLVATLPEGLREASCHWHLSASQHTHATLRCHLWFFLDRPYGDKEIKSALKLPGLDHSLFSPVQPHFVADPQFTQGTDPIPQRSGLLPGLTHVAEIRGIQGAQRLRDAAQEYLAKAEREIKSAISNHRARHPVINKWAFELGSLCPHLISETEVFQRLFQAATQTVGDQPGLPPDRAQDEISRAIADGKATPKLVGEDWKGLLKYGKGFEVSPTLGNLVTILTHDPRWEGVLGYNLRGETPCFRREPPLLDEMRGGSRGARQLEDSDDTRFVSWLERHYNLTIPNHQAWAALLAAAKESPFDPVTEYLDGLDWDNTPRLDTLASTVLGDPSQIANEALRLWLISAVKRAYEPGCQADHAIILEGPQGAGKSSFLRWLSPEFYRSLGGDLSTKESVQKLQGYWLIDLTELASVRRTEVGAIKEFISCVNDSERFAYGKLVKSYPRKCVIAGTINPDEFGYLKDNTGNRRFWPITVGEKVNFPDDPVRDQIWAEARERYRAGETTWELSSQALAELAEKHASRLEENPHTDPWLDTISQWLARRSSATLSEVLELALCLPADRRDRRTAVRVGRLLKHLGWARQSDKRTYLPPDTHTPSTARVIPLHQPKP